MALQCARILTVDNAFFQGHSLNGTNRAPSLNEINVNQFVAGISRAGTCPSDRGATNEKKPVSPTVTFLDGAQLRSFLEAMQSDPRTSVMQAPKLTMFNGQEGTLKCLDRQFYTKVQAISNGGNLLFLPKNESCETGLTMSLRPIVSGDQRFVRLRLNGTLTSLLSLSPAHDQHTDRGQDAVHP